MKNNILSSSAYYILAYCIDKYKEFKDNYQYFIIENLVLCIAI